MRLRVLPVFFYYAALTLAVIALLGPHPQLIRYAYAMFDSTSRLALLALVPLTLVFPPTRRWLAALGRLLHRVANLPPWFVLCACGIIFFGLTGALSQLLFGGVPHIADTHAQYVHAKILAQGHLYLPSHPLPWFFDFQTFANAGKYYSGYPPGHIAILALGHLAHLPWLVNPLLGALTLPAVYLLTREVENRVAGYTAVTLTMLSPFVVFMSSEFMNHATCLLFSTLFLFAYIRQHRTNDWRFALMAGLCVGYAFITRPQAVLFFAFPAAVHALAAFAAEPRRRWRTTLAMAMTFAGVTSLMLIYNDVLSGSPWLLGNVNPRTYLNPTEGNTRTVLYQSWLRATRQSVSLNTHLFGWPRLSLIFVLLLFALRGAPRYGKLLIMCCLAQYAGLFINPFSDGLFGPRYLYETAAPLIALTAIFFTRLPALARRCFRLRLPPAAWHGAEFLTVCLLLNMASALFIPHLYRIYSNNYWEGDASYARAITQAVQPPAIIIFQNYEEFRKLYFLQPPTDDAPIIFARDRGVLNQKLMDYYPNRTVYWADNLTLLRLR